MTKRSMQFESPERAAKRPSPETWSVPARMVQSAPAIPTSKLILFAGQTEPARHQNPVRAAKKAMIIQAASMKLYAAEDVVANERGIEFFREMKETKKELREMREMMESQKNFNKRVEEDIIRLQKRFLQERRRIISTFVRDSKFPQNQVERRMVLNAPENKELKASMELIRELNQKTHGGNIHEDARMALAFFEPSNEEYKAIETLYQMTPQEITLLGKHEDPFKGLCQNPPLTRNG
ncbi:hypothetical protein N7539_001313 [Penicillium diatomitis]|uniref:Uncharacterized protein n=1 Tax=Penicillium diatomitis TaxID=2819901 RepID=A0A9W9XGH6_9EURO|nr:uncharacterized protein N7539_001313 [Penicillium diatomitis]KAJ5492567.1 hypothetical protein N7539_001313 [Penicillium diatomitis]